MSATVGNIGFGVELSKLIGTKVVELGPNKVKCIVIPIEANNLFVKDEKVKLDLIAFEKKEPGQYGDTHMVKQSLPKEVRGAMSQEDLNAMPILGNAKVLSAPALPLSSPRPQVDPWATSPKSKEPTGLGGDLPFDLF